MTVNNQLQVQENVKCLYWSKKDPSLDYDQTRPLPLHADFKN